MPKIKVHSGAAKRFKKTGSGFKRKQANKRHILTKCRPNPKGNSEEQLHLLTATKN